MLSVSKKFYLTDLLARDGLTCPAYAALPGTLRIAEENLNLRSHREAFVLSHLQPAVPGQRAT